MTGPSNQPQPASNQPMPPQPQMPPSGHTPPPVHPVEKPKEEKKGLEFWYSATSHSDLVSLSYNLIHPWCFQICSQWWCNVQTWLLPKKLRDLRVRPVSKMSRFQRREWKLIRRARKLEDGKQTLIRYQSYLHSPVSPYLHSIVTQ